MKRAIMLLLSVVLLYSCGSMQPRVKFDTTEKVMIGVNVGLQIGDIHSTARGLEKGAMEVNPILGKNPNLEKLLALKAVTGAASYYLLSQMDHTERKIYLVGLATLFSFVVYNNYSM